MFTFRNFISKFVSAKKFIASISHPMMGATSIGTRATGFFGFFYVSGYNSTIVPYLSFKASKNLASPFSNFR
jgi:hypothetical protein